VRLLADVDVGLPPAQHPVDERSDLARGGKHGDGRSLPAGDATIVGPPSSGAFPHRHGRVAERRPGACGFEFSTLFEWLSPRDGLPGRQFRSATNSFSLAKRFIFTPYSLSTASAVSVPTPSIVVRSTPARRYSAWRFSSTCRRFMAFRLAALRNGGALDSARSAGVRACICLCISRS
jgi:hypothetical protein